MWNLWHHQTVIGSDAWAPSCCFSLAAAWSDCHGSASSDFLLYFTSWDPPAGGSVTWTPAVWTCSGVEAGLWHTPVTSSTNVTTNGVRPVPSFTCGAVSWLAGALLKSDDILQSFLTSSDRDRKWGSNTGPVFSSAPSPAFNPLRLKMFLRRSAGSWSNCRPMWTGLANSAPWQAL